MVRFRQCGDAQTTAGEIADFVLPCIVKPLDGTGSADVCRIDKAEDIQTWLKDKGDSPQHWIIESFLHGPEFSVEAFSEQGKHRIIAVTEKFKRNSDYIESGHLVPARIGQRQQEKIEQYISNVLDSLGIRNGPTHSEVIVCGDSVELVETHTRTGGDRIVSLLKLSCDIDLYALTAAQALGQTVMAQLPEHIVHKQSAAIAFKFVESDIPTFVEAIETPVLPEESYGVKDVKIYLDVGSKIHRVKHSHGRAAHVICVDKDGHHALKKAQDYLKQVHYRLKPSD